MGEQDAPFAELKEMKINDNLLELKYHYYESIGLPDIGEGFFSVIYKIDSESKSIIYENIKCDIIKKAQYIDGGYSSNDPKYKIDPPQNINYTKEEFNNKFKYLLKEYSFIY